MSEKVTAARIIEAYVKTRDEIAEIEKVCKAEVAKLKVVQKKREQWLQTEMDRTGSNSFNTDHGTAFTDFFASTKVSDREQFLEWVHADWEARSTFIENRVSKTAVKQRLDDGDTLPPGTEHTQIKNVKVRRK